jgi:hypothetical protein
LTRGPRLVRLRRGGWVGCRGRTGSLAFYGSIHAWHWHKVQRWNKISSTCCSWILTFRYEFRVVSSAVNISVLISLVCFSSREEFLLDTMMDFFAEFLRVENRGGILLQTEKRVPVLWCKN